MRAIAGRGEQRVPSVGLRRSAPALQVAEMRLQVYGADSEPGCWFSYFPCAVSNVSLYFLVRSRMAERRQVQSNEARAWLEHSAVQRKRRAAEGTRQATRKGSQGRAHEGLAAKSPALAQFEAGGQRAGDRPPAAGPQPRGV